MCSLKSVAESQAKRMRVDDEQVVIDILQVIKR